MSPDYINPFHEVVFTNFSSFAASILLKMRYEMKKLDVQNRPITGFDNVMATDILNPIFAVQARPLGNMQRH